MAKPGHAAVMDAVRRSGDIELQQLVRTEDSYVLRATPMDGVSAHDVYRLLLVQVPHPMSVWLTVTCDAKQVDVLTRNLPAIRDFLAREPAVAGAADLAARFVELYRAQEVRVHVLDAPRPEVTRAGADLRIAVAVELAGRRERWDASLPAKGAPALRITTLPAPVREAAP